MLTHGWSPGEQMASVALVVPWDVMGQKMLSRLQAPSAPHGCCRRVKRAVNVGCRALENLQLLLEELWWVRG